MVDKKYGQKFNLRRRIFSYFYLNHNTNALDDTSDSIIRYPKYQMKISHGIFFICCFIGKEEIFSGAYAFDKKVHYGCSEFWNNYGRWNNLFHHGCQRFLKNILNTLKSVTKRI